MDLFFNIPVLPTEAISLAPDAVEGAIILDNPVDLQASRIGEATLRRLCSIHGIPFEDVLVPSRKDRPHLSPAGYTACNKFMCGARCVPPFNSFVREMLRYLGIAPTQLHPNNYAFIHGTILLFMNVLFHPPTPKDIRYIYNFKRWSGSPSYVFLEPSPKCQVLTGAWNKLSLFEHEWFYVRCPPGFARRWLERCVHPRPVGVEYSRAVAAICATPVEDRNIKLLVTDELLSLFGLLEDGCEIRLLGSIAAPTIVAEERVETSDPVVPPFEGTQEDTKEGKFKESQDVRPRNEDALQQKYTITTSFLQRAIAARCNSRLLQRSVQARCNRFLI